MVDVCKICRVFSTGFCVRTATLSALIIFIKASIEFAHHLVIATREKACLIFNELTTNLEERSLAEKADTDLARDRADFGKSPTIGVNFEVKMDYVEKIEEGLEIIQDLEDDDVRDQTWKG